MENLDWKETERVANLMSAGELWYAEDAAIKAAKHFDAQAGTDMGWLGGYYHDQASVYRKVRREKEGRKTLGGGVRLSDTVIKGRSTGSRPA